MEGISKSLPALMRTQKVQGKAGKNGYVFSEPLVSAESIANMINVLGSDAPQDVSEKYIGKMLFELVSVARAFGVDAETALSQYTNTFVKDFGKHEG